MPIIPTATISIRDAKGRVSKMQYYLDTTNYPDGFTIPDATWYLQELTRRLSPIITGAIVGVDLSISIQPHASVRQVPLSTSDVEEKALFIFNGGGNQGAYQNHIPTFNHALFPPGSDQMSTFHNSDVSYFALFVGQPDLAIDNAGGFDGITDNRGLFIATPPMIYKRFRAR